MHPRVPSMLYIHKLILGINFQCILKWSCCVSHADTPRQAGLLSMSCLTRPECAEQSDCDKDPRLPVRAATNSGACSRLTQVYFKAAKGIGTLSDTKMRFEQDWSGWRKTDRRNPLQAEAGSLAQEYFRNLVDGKLMSRFKPILNGTSPVLERKFGVTFRRPQ